MSKRDLWGDRHPDCPERQQLRPDQDFTNEEDNNFGSQSQLLGSGGAGGKGIKSGGGLAPTTATSGAQGPIINLRLEPLASAATGTAPYHRYPPMKVLLLTLQNDPPCLETGTEERDQYRAYGKSFRKLIVDCLQKDPTKRPTATELLKHPFLKKAKDRRYLVQTLIAQAPSLEARSQKTRSYRKAPGASGRLHRTEAGDWIWSSDSEDEAHSNDDSDDEGQSEKPPNPLIQKELSQQQQSDSRASDTHLSGSSTSSCASAISEPEDAGHRPLPAAPPFAPEPLPTQSQAALVGELDPINLVLRMRNAKRELNDIRFEFSVGRDSADGIASELVAAGLVDGRDLVVIAANLQKILDGLPITTSVTFGLSSGCVGNEVPDDRTLVGFAQLSIAE